ncbi:uncharacterized protein FOMMEDRAFT_145137 [Fomitiporia mediterranea MF3/22]|uniref:uncharacterized protein n=1 Tax=Fomitiporia mediterranea (strain MF3/22) TaxID=694068 RepID=UPI0004407DCD|nr:uncharacterized protein FOMMEDRAFT_145137 [Fomitiporia mediterranea MF3/22]EJD05691.1 hypothetical protein FOMMEDRAFT_145137 [Fomitiporia mediterranea MF3/22]
MTSSATIPVPAVVQKFFSKFPLYTYPYDDSESLRLASSRQTRPTLWIAPPNSTKDVLSTDAECLKWQAYIALRGVKNVGLRWDIAAEGAVDGRLPSLVAYEGGKPEVLGARMIPGWVDGVLQVEEDAFEGYRDTAMKDESRAWVALLEGTVHSALMLFNPAPKTLKSFLLYTPHVPTGHSASPNQPSLSMLLSPPPAPLSGFTTVFPLYGERVSRASIKSQYRDAIKSLSDRLGNDTWFLGSSGPTALDALVFAYLRCLLAGPDELRTEVVHRLNLCEWERRVREIVQSSFVLSSA